MLSASLKILRVAKELKLGSQKLAAPHVHCHNIHNSQAADEQVKKNVVDTYNGIWFSLNKEGTPAICDNGDEPRRRYAKPVTDGQLLCDFILHEVFQIDSQNPRIEWWLPGAGGGRGRWGLFLGGIVLVMQDEEGLEIHSTTK